MAVLYFTDDEAAKSGLIQGSSPNPHSANFTQQVRNLEMDDAALLWFARVPSASIIADAPSRGACRPCWRVGQPHAPVEVNWELPCWR